MPEVTITYKTPETLKVLRTFAKYFDFKITASKTKKLNFKVNGVTIVPGIKTSHPSEIQSIFSGKDISASELREKAWQRK